MRFKPFVTRLEKLGLHAMAAEYRMWRNSEKFHELTSDQLLKYMVEAQLDDEANTAVNKLILKANLPYVNANRNSIDYAIKRQLNVDYLKRLLNCEWIEDGNNLIITGDARIGKSFLACALANEAMKKGNSVKYVKANLFVEDIQQKRNLQQHDVKSRVYKALLKVVEEVDLLVLDDFGLKALGVKELEDIETMLSMRKINNKSVLLLSPIPTSHWKNEFIGTPAIKTLIHQLIEGSYVFNLKRPNDELPKYTEIFCE